MKIVNIIGGLGNQMFQYAMAAALKGAFPQEDVKISVQSFRGYPLHNGFELNRIFNLTISEATLKELAKVAYPWSHYRLWQIGRRCLPQRQSMIWDKDIKGTFSFDRVADKSYFDGYWQSPQFFESQREAIINAYKFPELTDEKNKEAIHFIKSGQTAFIHIRRGDYLKNKIYGGICTEIYYDRAIKRILQSDRFNRFIIFSNDIDWCRERFVKMLNSYDIIFADWNTGTDSYRDMQLMSLCKGAIIANSSFSWWGAWLGNMDTVICPELWCNIQGHRDDIFPNSWIRIKIK